MACNPILLFQPPKPTLNAAPSYPDKPRAHLERPPPFEEQSHATLGVRPGRAHATRAPVPVAAAAAPTATADVLGSGGAAGGGAGAAVGPTQVHGAAELPGPEPARKARGAAAAAAVNGVTVAWRGRQLVIHGEIPEHEGRGAATALGLGQLEPEVLPGSFPGDIAAVALLAPCAAAAAAATSSTAIAVSTAVSGADLSGGVGLLPRSPALRLLLLLLLLQWRRWPVLVACWFVDEHGVKGLVRGCARHATETVVVVIVVVIAVALAAALGNV